MNTEKLRGWLSGRLPDDWFESEPQLVVDREEIVVVGTIPAPATPDDASQAQRSAAVAGRVKQFREDTRERRMAIARELEHATGRKVAWGVDIEGERTLFTTLSVPVMTRLRQPERQTLDILVDGGVARSRSEALAWCVRLVGRNSQEWLADLTEAMRKVADVREAGPDA
jgi:hypothetical protein